MHEIELCTPADGVSAHLRRILFLLKRRSGSRGAVISFPRLSVLPNWTADIIKLRGLNQAIEPSLASNQGSGVQRGDCSQAKPGINFLSNKQDYPEPGGRLWRMHDKRRSTV